MLLCGKKSCNRKIHALEICASCCLVDKHKSTCLEQRGIRKPEADHVCQQEKENHHLDKGWNHRLDGGHSHHLNRGCCLHQDG